MPTGVSDEDRGLQANGALSLNGLRDVVLVVPENDVAANLVLVYHVEQLFV